MTSVGSMGRSAGLPSSIGWLYFPELKISAGLSRFRAGRPLGPTVMAWCSPSTKGKSEETPVVYPAALTVKRGRGQIGRTARGNVTSESRLVGARLDLRGETALSR